MSQIQVDRIVMLRSLGREDIGVSRRVESDIRDLVDEFPVVTVEVKNIANRSAFLKVMLHLSNSINSRGVPLIHLDMHGDKEKGLCLESGEYVSWKQLSLLLGMINERTGNRMVVVSCACFSLATIAYFDVSKPAPFSYFTGPARTLNNGVIEKHMRVFYGHLLAGNSLKTTTESLGSDFHHFYPETIMFYIVRDELRSYEGRPGSKTREGGITEVVDELKARGKEFEIKEVRRKIKSIMEDLTDEKLQRYLEIFLCGRAPYFTAEDIRASKTTPYWVNLASGKVEPYADT